MGFAVLNPSEDWTRVLTFRHDRNIVTLSRLVQGASDQRHETRGGMRWPLRGARRAFFSGRFKPRPAVLAAGVSVEERPPGTMEQTFKHRARNADAFRRSVVTIAHALSHFAHEAMGFR